MDDAAAIAERYINSTIPCYFTEPNSNVYLTKIDNLESFVGLTSAFGFIIVVIMIIIIRSFRKNDDCCISSAWKQSKAKYFKNKFKFCISILRY